MEHTNPSVAYTGSRYMVMTNGSFTTNHKPWAGKYAITKAISLSSIQNTRTRKHVTTPTKLSTTIKSRKVGTTNISLCVQFYTSTSWSSRVGTLKCAVSGWVHPNEAGWIYRNDLKLENTTIPPSANYFRVRLANTGENGVAQFDNLRVTLHN